MLRSIIRITKPIRYFLDSCLYFSHGKDPLGSLKDIYKDQTVLIVGNGPSLNSTPLDRFSGVPSIGMNKIDLIFDKVNWRPSFIVAENTLVVRQHWKQMLSHGIQCICSWKTRWSVPITNRAKFVWYLSLQGKEFSKGDLTNGLGVSATVTFTALQIAYYMGAKNVIIVGVDHNFETKGKPLNYERRSGPDVNHFDPNYFKSNTFWGVPDLDLSEEGYHAAQEAYEVAGRKIYDATVGGKLQVFEKISIDQAVRIANPNQSGGPG